MINGRGCLMTHDALFLRHHLTSAQELKQVEKISARFTGLQDRIYASRRVYKNCTTCSAVRGVNWPEEYLPHIKKNVNIPFICLL
jgi:hypothetical protein